MVIPGIDGQRGSVAPIVDRLGQHRRVLLVDYAAEVEPDLDSLAEAIAELLPEDATWSASRSAHGWRRRSRNAAPSGSVAWR